MATEKKPAHPRPRVILPLTVFLVRIAVSLLVLGALVYLVIRLERAAKILADVQGRTRDDRPMQEVLGKIDALDTTVAKRCEQSAEVQGELNARLDDLGELNETLTNFDAITKVVSLSESIDELQTTLKEADGRSAPPPPKKTEPSPTTDQAPSRGDDGGKPPKPKTENPPADPPRKPSPGEKLAEALAQIVMNQQQSDIERARMQVIHYLTDASKEGHPPNIDALLKALDFYRPMPGETPPRSQADDLERRVRTLHEKLLGDTDTSLPVAGLVERNNQLLETRLSRRATVLLCADTTAVPVIQYQEPVNMTLENYVSGHYHIIKVEVAGKVNRTVQEFHNSFTAVSNPEGSSAALPVLAQEQYSARSLFKAVRWDAKKTPYEKQVVLIVPLATSDDVNPDAILDIKAPKDWAPDKFRFDIVLLWKVQAAAPNQAHRLAAVERLRRWSDFCRLYGGSAHLIAFDEEDLEAADDSHPPVFSQPLKDNLHRILKELLVH